MEEEALTIIISLLLCQLKCAVDQAHTWMCELTKRALKCVVDESIS